MKLSEHLQGVNKLFLDTAPVVYYIEENYIAFKRLEELNIIVLDDYEPE